MRELFCKHGIPSWAEGGCRDCQRSAIADKDAEVATLRSSLARAEAERDEATRAADSYRMAGLVTVQRAREAEAERDARPAITPEDAAFVRGDAQIGLQAFQVMLGGAETRRVIAALRAHAAKAAPVSATISPTSSEGHASDLSGGGASDRDRVSPSDGESGSLRAGDGGEVCPECRGRGGWGPAPSWKCPACNGTGRAKGGDDA